MLLSFSLEGTLALQETRFRKTMYSNAAEKLEEVFIQRPYMHKMNNSTSAHKPSETVSSLLRKVSVSAQRSLAPAFRSLVYTFSSELRKNRALPSHLDLHVENLPSLHATWSPVLDGFSRSNATHEAVVCSQHFFSRLALANHFVNAPGPVRVTSQNFFALTNSFDMSTIDPSGFTYTRQVLFLSAMSPYALPSAFSEIFPDTFNKLKLFEEKAHAVLSDPLLNRNWSEFAALYNMFFNLPKYQFKNSSAWSDKQHALLREFLRSSIVSSVLSEGFKQVPSTECLQTHMHLVISRLEGPLAFLRKELSPALLSSLALQVHSTLQESLPLYLRPSLALLPVWNAASSTPFAATQFSASCVPESYRYVSVSTATKEYVVCQVPFSYASQAHATTFSLQHEETFDVKTSLLLSGSTLKPFFTSQSHSFILSPDPTVKQIFSTLVRDALLQQRNPALATLYESSLKLANTSKHIQ